MLGCIVLFLALDVVLQGVIGTLICAWESGFSVFLVCMIPVFFYIPYRRKWLAWVQAVMAAGRLLLFSIAICDILILLHDGSYESSILRIERLRRQIEEGSYVYKGIDLSITLTFGVCSNEETAGYKEMLQEADRRLYQGKKNGKNQVISA